MSLREKINEDIKKAMQKKNELLLLVLRGVNAAIHNKEIEKRTKLSKNEKDIKKLEELSKLSDEEILEAVSSEAKKRKEAIIEFSALGGSASGGGKEKIDNAINKEKLELEILKKYLPEQMDEGQIKEKAQKAIKESGATGPQDTGRVMSVLMSKLKGKADGSLVSKIVAELLNNL